MNNGTGVFWTEGEEIRDWGGLQKLEAQLLPSERETGKRWVFRGERLRSDVERRYYPTTEVAPSYDPRQGNEGYLETHLEKAFRLNGIEDEDKGSEETRLIRRFQRKATLYLEHEPDKDDILEWLAIMRHHGAQTRLLDWVYSFYIAVYFALNESESGVVWALDASKMMDPEPLVQRICGERDGFREFSQGLLHCLKQSDFLGIRAKGDKLIDLAIAYYVIKHPLSCVYPVNPFRLNKRLSVQQGLFLMIGDITKSFVENLTASFEGLEQTKAHLRRMKIVPPKKERKEILRKLKDMNISNEALFPGLDGFARSVGEEMAYPRPLSNEQE